VSVHFRNGSTASVGRSRHVGLTPDSGRMAATQLNDASGHFRTRGHLRALVRTWSVATSIAAFRRSDLAAKHANPDRGKPASDQCLSELRHQTALHDRHVSTAMPSAVRRVFTLDALSRQPAAQPSLRLHNGRVDFETSCRPRQRPQNGHAGPRPFAQRTHGCCDTWRNSPVGRKNFEVPTFSRDFILFASRSGSSRHSV
jgi:hypothetical protein